MKIEVAKHERMAERGSSLLKLLQNNDTPLLDLLIRESVQNSLDAALQKYDSVTVDVGTKEFNSDLLIRHLEGIQTGLNKRFGGKNAKALYISDTNTVGLTGPFYAEEVEDNNYGNLQKLVYEISIPQQKSGAGGSWGLGKTVYFRFGIGLVFYYSRILKEDGNYEERLAATMVEDEKSEDAILPSKDNKPKRGIAWWGQISKDEGTVPITDSEEIKEILNTFSIENFRDQETGTKIIIPFIDENKLLPKEDLWWNSSIEEYFKVSFQRWYGTRIDNPLYPYGSWLNAHVNGKQITFNEMEPLFQIIQVLYNGALSIKKEKEKESVDQRFKFNFNISEINLRGDFKNTSGGNAGKVAFSKFTQENLKMLPPENRYSPYTYINSENNSENGNPPILVYLRKPGMIINYETDGAWCNDIPMTTENEFIVGVFVPNSDSEFKNGHMEEYGVLEQYLRRSEKADHTSWKDLISSEKRITVISRIQNNVAKAIREKYIEDKEKAQKGKRSALSKSLANKLLPPQNFGRKPTDPPGKPGGTTKGRKLTKTQFQIKEQHIDKQGILNLEFEIQSPKLHNSTLELVVLSENGLIKGDTWESDNGVGTDFPLVLKEVKISSFGSIDHKEKETQSSEEDLTLPIKLVRTKKTGIVCGIEYSSGRSNGLLSGVLKVERKDPFIQPSISLSSVGVDKNDK
ncbi:hypothetical protein ACTL32_05260 [Planococcus sp. FY231025]|uniref:hypothetical protein n=1 Tax=Planococcus sp. FY231025 TaxID=3455699 RepID=UPI003F90B9D2